MFYHFPEIKSLRTVPAITTRKRSHDWIAFLPNDASAWERGVTEAEARGLLLLSHADRLGGRLHREEERSSQSKQR